MRDGALVQNPAALLTVDDFPRQFRLVYGGRGIFHMATHTNLVLHRYDRSAIFTGEQSLVPGKQVWVNGGRQRFALGSGFAKPSLQCLLFLGQRGQLLFRLEQLLPAPSGQSLHLRSARSHARVG